MSTKSRLIQKLGDPDYRKAFVRAELNMGLPLQIRALRKQRGLSQQELAARTGMRQSRVSSVEQPGHGNVSLATLIRFAEAFDVGLQVRFVSYGDLVEWSETFDPEGFEVPSFGQEELFNQNPMLSAEPHTIVSVGSSGDQFSISGGYTAQEFDFSPPKPTAASWESHEETTSYVKRIA